MPGNWQGSNRAATLPPNWQAIRKAVLRRDRGVCQLRIGAGICGAPANQVDHIDDPTDHSIYNLRALCEPHHAQRSSQQGNAARWAPQRRERRPPEPHPGIRRN